MLDHTRAPGLQGRWIAAALPGLLVAALVAYNGDALGQAHRAVEGDITGVTASLGDSRQPSGSVLPQ